MPGFDFTMPSGNQWGVGGNTFNFGGGGGGMNPGYGAMNNWGMASPTLGSGAASWAPQGGWGSAPGAGASGMGFGMNMPSLQLGLGAINSLANLWGGFQGQKLARDQFDFTKNMANTNLNNSIQSYNTALDDRARARGFTEGQSQGQIDKYVADNRMVR